MELDLHEVELAVCRLRADEELPEWAAEPQAPLHAITRTAGELSVVTAEEVVPDDATTERGWRAFEVRGPLDFGLTGVLASLASPLADAAVPIFALSTHDTDWVLVPEVHLEAAVGALQAAGHHVER